MKKEILSVQSMVPILTWIPELFQFDNQKRNQNDWIDAKNLNEERI